MKKAMVLTTLALAGAALMTGCVSSSGTRNEMVDKFNTWQEERVYADEIAAKEKAAQPLTIDDVLYKSGNPSIVMSTPFNTLAAGSAALYLQVVNGVDRLAAQNEGRRIFVGVQNDVAAGSKLADILATMPAADKQAYTDYENAIKAEDQAKIMDTVVTPLLSTLATEAAKVAVVVSEVRSTDEFKALAGIELVRTSGYIVADSKALSAQFSDATDGANIWLDLLKQDKAAKEFMANYTVE